MSYDALELAHLSDECRIELVRITAKLSDLETRLNGHKSSNDDLDKRLRRLESLLLQLRAAFLVCAGIVVAWKFGLAKLLTIVAL